MAEMQTSDAEMDNVTMTGSAVSFTVPANTRAVSFHADGADISLTFATGGSGPWKIPNGTKEHWPYAILQGKTLYATGTAASTLRLIYWKVL